MIIKTKRTLLPATRYYYSFSFNDTPASNPMIYNFTTAPDFNANFKFAIVGDMQPTNALMIDKGRIVAEGLNRYTPNFVVQLGDISNTGGDLNSWQKALQNVARLSASQAFQGVVGNHDYLLDNGANFRSFFPRPYKNTQGLYYSFDYGNVHLIMLDNFEGSSSTMSDAQRFWAENDIVQAKNRGQKWIFIFFHTAILTTGTSTQDWDLQRWLMPLCDQYNVDGVFFGHDHHYEHWNFTYGASGYIFNQSHMPTGWATQYWCSGTGGAHLE
jgi:3',5'-cyclic AMP phosphodiesterase CpdA